MNVQNCKYISSKSFSKKFYKMFQGHELSTLRDFQEKNFEI